MINQTPKNISSTAPEFSSDANDSVLIPSTTEEVESGLIKPHNGIKDELNVELELFVRGDVAQEGRPQSELYL